MYFDDAKILTINMIKEKHFSLKYDDYFRVEDVKQDKDGWIKLGNFCHIYKSKKKAGAH